MTITQSLWSVDFEKWPAFQLIHSLENRIWLAISPFLILLVKRFSLNYVFFFKFFSSLVKVCFFDVTAQYCTGFIV
jgi:hypothetical protein